MKDHNYDKNMRKRTCNKPNVDLVNVNAYIKFGENLSTCFQDIDRKRHSGVLSGNEIMKDGRTDERTE